jgi:hypothetical protein
MILWHKLANIANAGGRWRLNWYFINLVTMYYICHKVAVNTFHCFRKAIRTSSQRRRSALSMLRIDE